MIKITRFLTRTWNHEPIVRFTFMSGNENNLPQAVQSSDKFELQVLLFRVVFVNCLALCQPLLWQIRMDQVDRVVRLKEKNIQLKPGFHRISPISWNSVRYGRSRSFLYCFYTNALIARGDRLRAIVIAQMEKYFERSGWLHGNQARERLYRYSIGLKKEALIANEILSLWAVLPQQMQWAYGPVEHCAPFRFM